MVDLYPPLPSKPPSTWGTGLLSKLFALLVGMVFLLYIPSYMLAVALTQAYVLMHLWAWFVVPTFHLPALSLPLAIGMRLVLGFLTPLGMPHPRKDDKEEERDKAPPKDPEGRRRAGVRAVWIVASLHLLAIAAPLAWLAVGWIIKSYFL